jgi:histidine transport system ATP-binding protein
VLGEIEMHKLTVDELHKKYGNLEVLKGVSLKAKAGDVISIIGSSGSGKSTFLRCINFLEQPCAGSITLNGEAIRTSPDKQGALCVADPKQLQQMRTKLAMVFQHFNLWGHMTVLENIIESPMHVLGLSRDEAVARARKYLAKVGLPESVEDKYPSHMSGGQQQRVAIARAGDGAGGYAVRRADLCTRPGAGGRGAEGDAVAGRGRPHHDRGDARDGLRARGIQSRSLPTSWPH